MSDAITKYWYACKVFFNRVFEVEEALKTLGVECYIPVVDVVVERKGVTKKIRKPLISSLAFFQSSPDKVAHIADKLGERVMIYSSRKEEGVVPTPISEREMNIFILVTSAGEAGIEYLGDDNPGFYTGEPVEVIDGPFKGAIGHIKRIKGNHRLIVTIEGLCAVATSYIPRCFLRKIES